nr:metallophosphoesterase [uncultured Desulfobacter sp.]
MPHTISLGTRHRLRLLLISDVTEQSLIHEIKNKTLPPIDLTISCGDMAPEYLRFIRNRLDTPLYYVKGNHDIRYTPDSVRGCQNLHGRVVTVGDLKIMGLEGSMWYNGGPNQYTEAAMRKQIFRMGFTLWRKKPIHMVITHAPPLGIHDSEDLCHKGFDVFNRLISRLRPDYFIHGHIHQAYERFEDRMTLSGTTKIINTCGHTIIEI